MHPLPVLRMISNAQLIELLQIIAARYNQPSAAFLLVWHFGNESNQVVLGMIPTKRQNGIAEKMAKWQNQNGSEAPLPPLPSHTEIFIYELTHFCGRFWLLSYLNRNEIENHLIKSVLIHL